MGKQSKARAQKLAKKNAIPKNISNGALKINPDDLKLETGFSEPKNENKRKYVQNKPKMDKLDILSNIFLESLQDKNESKMILDTWSKIVNSSLEFPCTVFFESLKTKELDFGGIDFKDFDDLPLINEHTKKVYYENINHDKLLPVLFFDVDFDVLQTNPSLLPEDYHYQLKLFSIDDIKLKNAKLVFVSG